MKLLKYTVPFIKDFFFYYREIGLSRRKTWSIVKIMYLEGIPFSCARQVRSERKYVRKLEEEESKALEKSRKKALESRLAKQGISVLKGDMAEALDLAFPNQKRQLNVTEALERTDLDKQDAQDMYLILYDVLTKGWSFRPDSQDPTFYYYDKYGKFAWASHPRDVNYKFNSEMFSKRFGRDDYASIMKRFSTKIYKCYYEEFLEFVVSHEKLIGGGKDGPQTAQSGIGLNFVDKTKAFSNFNNEVIFCELKATFKSRATVSIPVNCFDQRSWPQVSGVDYVFEILNQEKLDSNKHVFEYYKVDKITTDNRFVSADKYRSLVREGIYNISLVSDEDGVYESLDSCAAGCGFPSGESKFSRVTAAWRYVGDMTSYGETFAKSLFSGVDQHIWYNLSVEPLGRPVNVSVSFVINLRFYARMIGTSFLMDKYYNKVDKKGSCFECENSDTELFSDEDNVDDIPKDSELTMDDLHLDEEEMEPGEYEYNLRKN